MPKGSNAALILIAGCSLIALLSYGSAVIAPVIFALFIIILVWPLQRILSSVLPRYLALVITFLLVVLLLLGFGWLIAWTVGQIGRRILIDAARYQLLYEQLRIWLDAHGIAVSVLWSDNFNVSWALRNLQSIGSRLNNTFSFWLVALVYVLLGLAETDEFNSRIKRLKNQTSADTFVRGCRVAAAKIRHYMLLRAAMSLVTGLFVWVFTRFIGLPFSTTWGFVAFILNFIPFVGPLAATLFITAFAFTQLAVWQSVLAIFVGLNVIQSVIGSILEPRLAGSTLSLSPVAVLFSVFAWGALWGVFGAFIGVPITIVLLTFSAQHPATSWFAEIFGFPPEQKLEREERPSLR
ncbi:AI-2E family transporter [Brucella pituitosa]|uniref:AI-2E family transporter n=1 Tax=Brucella pituitosa TaxID=571256 RepID=UPI000C27298C|nr:AI-2E family transporter [Brucella pituitosa]PJO49912.1 AI-2E family transporter [Brucella pituitosa]